jgi:hypothetical protein
MLIRSQNKEVLATLELLFDVEVSGGVISARRDMSWCCLLGEYSTKAKAIKVLDMIQEAYSEYQIMLNFSVSYLHEFKEKTDGFAIFQMPEDSEVEA